MTSAITENVARVRDRIVAACARVGRNPDDVTIVGVTKTFPAARIDALIDAGIADIGENRIQELVEKAPQVTRPCRWHFVGTLQRNKAGKAIGNVHLIHSVDRSRLADTLSRLSGEAGLTTRVLVEVNTSGEASKHGLSPDRVPGVVAEIAGLAHLRLEGLMTIGPLTDDLTAVRRAFQTLFRLHEKIETRERIELPHLSMGMSGDFEVAVEEGATMVRLGRVLLGERDR